MLEETWWKIGRSSVLDLAYDETSARASRKRTPNEVIFEKKKKRLFSRQEGQREDCEI